MMLSFLGLMQNLCGFSRKGVGCFKLWQITYINYLFRRQPLIFLTIGDFKEF
jgi:hypothetical protein